MKPEPQDRRPQHHHRHPGKGLGLEGGVVMHALIVVTGIPRHRQGGVGCVPDRKRRHGRLFEAATERIRTTRPERSLVCR